MVADGRRPNGRLRAVRVDGAARRGGRSPEDGIRQDAEAALDARDARRAAAAASRIDGLCEAAVRLAKRYC